MEGRAVGDVHLGSQLWLQVAVGQVRGQVQQPLTQSVLGHGEGVNKVGEPVD